MFFSIEIYYSNVVNNQWFLIIDDDEEIDDEEILDLNDLTDEEIAVLRAQGLLVTLALFIRTRFRFETMYLL